MSANAVAIVGMACRFPGASDLETFWANLAAGVESIRTFSREELLAAGMSPSLVDHPRLVTAHGAIEDIEGFDAEFFGYSPSEAALIDPQQRIFMECASDALEDGGFVPGPSAPATGVFAGCGVNFYLIRNVASTLDEDDVAGIYQAILGGEKDFMTSRVSYKLGLVGPAITIQAACATSLVAVHVAAQSLLNGECDMAVAGGASLRIPQVSGFVFHEGGIYSPDGHCRAFDEQSAGTASGSGAGAVVLKRLDDAVRDGDLIRAVLLGSAVGNDGALKLSFTAPGVSGQASVISEACAVAGVDPKTIGYGEMHGTGTALGDPIEIAAVKESLGEDWNPDWRRYIGSLKTNVGHLDTAAGVGGLIKTVLALQHGAVPPSLHFQRPNPKIDFSRGPLKVATALTPWPASNGAPKRASVSSFGLGGSNSHAVLEEAPPREPRVRREAWRLFPLSARTPEALVRMQSRLSDFLASHPEARLDDIAWTLATGRRVFAHAGVAVAKTSGGLADTLNRGEWQTAERPSVAPRVGFLFPGQGAQQVGAGRDLYATEPRFRQAMDECAEALMREGAADVRTLLFREPTPAAEQEIRRTVHAQAVLFALGCSLAALWTDRGLTPAAVLGHSSGEFAAAACAGVMTIDAAARGLMARARLMDQLPPGVMAAVGLDEAELRAELPDGLHIAAVNAPKLCTVAGTDAALKALEARLASRRIFIHRLQTARAFHSPVVDPMLPAFRSAMTKVSLSEPRVAFYSAVTGARAGGGEITDVDLWVRQVRQAVRFGPALRAVLDDGVTVLIEMGPGSTLSALAKRVAPENVLVVPGIPARGNESEISLKQLAQVWLAGCELDWAQMSAADRPVRIPLPTYPFDRKRHWIEPAASDSPRSIPEPHAGMAARSVLPAAESPMGFAMPAWIRSPRLAASSDRTLSGRWLVFGEADRLTDEIVERLTGAGASVTRRRRVDPDDDYSAVDRILVTSTLDAMERDGFDLLVQIARAMAGQGAAVGEIAVLTHGAVDVTGGESLDAWQALAIGPVLAIPEEFPGVTCRGIDLDLAEQGDHAGAVLAELRQPADDRVVAIRHGSRWRFQMTPIRLPAATGAASVLRENGVYLMTGGLGALGLTIARKMADARPITLALVGRGVVVPGSSKAEAIAAIESTGSTVRVYQADCADEPSMRAIVADLLQRDGTIHGVVHAAGVAGGGSLGRRTDEEMTPVLRPKTTGTEVLVRALEGVPLDFLVCFSSLAAYLPTAGQADYAGASAFLDVRAAMLRRKGVRAVSIDWDAWRDVGMAVAADLPDALRAARAHELEAIGLDPDLAVDAMWQVLAAGAGHVVVSRRDFGRLDPADEPRPEEQTSAAPVGVADGLERIWKTLLGVGSIAPEDDFFQLGGHSLLATSATFQIRQQLGCVVSIDEVFAHSSFGALVRLIEERADAGRSREVLLL